MANAQLTQYKDGRYCLSYYLEGQRVRETFSKKKNANDRFGEIERLKGKGLQIATKEAVSVDEAAKYATNLLAAKALQSH